MGHIDSSCLLPVNGVTATSHNKAHMNWLSRLSMLLNIGLEASLGNVYFYVPTKKLSNYYFLLAEEQKKQKMFSHTRLQA